MHDGTLPGYWENLSESFIADNGVQAKILADVTPAKLAQVVAGEIALPGEGAVRQRVLTGGCRLIDGLIRNSDVAARALLIYEGVQMSLYADMTTASVTATNTFNRTGGSFIADGWKVGQGVMPFGSTTATNDGVLGIVTAVTATTLVVTGTPYTNETGAAGFRLIKVGQPVRKPVAALAGTNGTTAPIPLIGGALDPRLDSTGIVLGGAGLLIVAMQAAVGALPYQVTVTCNRGLF